jgi:hypothetical protein
MLLRWQHAVHCMLCGGLCEQALFGSSKLQTFAPACKQSRTLGFLEAICRFRALKRRHASPTLLLSLGPGLVKLSRIPAVLHKLPVVLHVYLLYVSCISARDTFTAAMFSEGCRVPVSSKWWGWVVGAGVVCGRACLIVDTGFMCMWIPFRSCLHRVGSLEVRP